MTTTSIRAWLVALLAGAVVVAACSGGGDKEPAATTTPEAVATATTAAPTATAAAPRPTPGGPLTITGLFNDPRPKAPDATRSIPPRPASPFAAWDRKSVVVYDIDQAKETSYGEGLRPSFSADGTRLAFNATNSVQIVELATGTRTSFPAGGLASFVDNTNLYVAGAGEVRILDIRTGATTPLSQLSDPVLKAKLEQAARPGAILTADNRYRLERRLFDDKRPVTCAGGEEAQKLCRAEAYEQWTLTEVATGKVTVELRAVALSTAGANEVVLATTPQCKAKDGTLKWCETVASELRADDPPNSLQQEFAIGTTNIFIVSLQTGAAEFVTTTGYILSTRISPASWPLVADGRFVIWTDSFCGQPQGKTHIYERSTKKTTDTDATFWLKLSAKGLIGVDEFGPRALLDPATLQWKIVLPNNVSDVVESPDGRYLAVGGVLGHGGLCG